MVYVTLILLIIIITLIIYATAVLTKTSNIFNLIQDHQAVQNDINNGIIERIKNLEVLIDDIKR